MAAAIRALATTMDSDKAADCLFTAAAAIDRAYPKRGPAGVDLSSHHARLALRLAWLA